MNHVPPNSFQAFCGGISSHSPESVLKAHAPTGVKRNNYLMNGNSIKPGKFEGLPDFHDFSLTQCTGSSLPVLRFHTEVTFWPL